MAQAGHPSRQGLLSFLSLNFLCGCASGILQLALPLYALYLHANTVQLGLIAGVSSVGRMLIIIPSGLLIDRIGARRLYFHGTSLCAILVGALVLVSSPWALMAVMLFQGMAQSVSFLALQAGFLKRLPFLDQTQAGWQRGSTQLGYYLVGPVAGGLLLQENLYPLTFLVVAAVFSLAVLISLYRRLRGFREVADTAVQSHTGEWGKLRALLADPLLLQVLGIECLGAAIFMIFRTFAPPVAVEVLHLPIRAISFLIILQGSAAMSSLFCGGRLLLRYSAGQVFTGASLLVTTGMILLATAQGFPLFLLGGTIYGVGTGLLSLCSLTKIGSVAGEKGKIAALFSLSIAVGNTFGPVLGGVVGELLTVQAAFLTPVALFTGILAIASYYRFRSYEVETETVGD